MPPPPPRDVEQSRITVFHAPRAAESGTVLAALAAAGHDPRLVNYIATPPDRDALKKFFLLLRGGDQSLVRKYDPDVSGASPDDPFHKHGEFLGRHRRTSVLINGPVLATAHKARVCRTENAVKSFLGIDIPDEFRKAPKPKGLPQSLATVVTGDRAPVRKKEDPPKAERKPVENTRPKAGAAAAKRPMIEAKAKIEAGSESLKTAKAAKPAKKSAPKPVKKAGRRNEVNCGA